MFFFKKRLAPLCLFWEIFNGRLIGQKTSVAEAEGRLLKSFGFGRLCLASVIVCYQDDIVYGRPLKVVFGDTCDDMQIFLLTKNMNFYNTF